MPKLCVNIDHVATIREARKTYEPDPILAAEEAILGGADGITLHIREDRRHMQDEDLFRLREVVSVPLNLELAATEQMVSLALKSMPEMAMLVPEGRNEVTTEGGLDVSGDLLRIRDVVDSLASGGMRTSAFVDANQCQIDAVRECGFDVCEIHTGSYAEAFIRNNFSASSEDVQHELDKIRTSVDHAIELGLQCNAGHGLTLCNVNGIAAMSNILELHIGHSIISRSVIVGIQSAVREMKQQIKDSSNV